MLRRAATTIVVVSLTITAIRMIIALLLLMLLMLRIKAVTVVIGVVLAPVITAVTPRRIQRVASHTATLIALFRKTACLYLTICSSFQTLTTGCVSLTTQRETA